MKPTRVPLILALVAGSLVAPVGGEAQPPAKMPRIGVLMNLYSPEAEAPRALRQRLGELGYVADGVARNPGPRGWRHPVKAGLEDSRRR